MTTMWFFLLLSLTGMPRGDSVFVLGRCPVESVTAILAGCFLSDEEQVLLTQSLGNVLIAPVAGGARTEVNVFRLVLAAAGDRGFTPVWRSGLMLGWPSGVVAIAPQVWSVWDIDGDSRLELVVIEGDSCRVYHFEPDSLFTESRFFPGGLVLDAVVGDIDIDSLPDLVTLERVTDTSGEQEMVRVWGVVPEFRLRASFYPPRPEPDLRFSFLGSVRLDDYPGAPVVLAGEFSRLKPSVYGVVFPVSGDSFVITTRPFPFQEWFKKDEVLAAGSLSLFNVGDTLVAYGYFVPGSRPGGPARSFCALQDGEWRLLRLKKWASRLSGLVCRFNYQGKAGWLELRDNIFYFYGQEPFYWR